MAEHSMDLVIFGIVVALRIVVPLFIPKFPLPAMILAMIIDAADQTIFQSFTSLDLTNYQSYDKALDVYYLAIAYLSTMRNWQHQVAFDTSRFLWYYRLVGVALFEIFHIRALLLIFPNTFEYFFDFYQGVRTRWNPLRMSKRLVIGAAAFIWIVIKLPQEYWIHVAQNDVTDTLRDYPALIPVIAVAAGALLAAAWWVVTRRCPPADWSPSLEDPIRQAGRSMGYAPAPLRLFAGRGFDRALLEKIVLVSLISIIFGQILPNTSVSSLQLTVGIATVIIGNMLVSGLLERRGQRWRNVLTEFAAMLAVNGLLALAFIQIAPSRDSTINRGSLLFFLFLLTLLVLLFDRYRPFYKRRLQESNLQAVD
jgi:hypothetical protein